MRYYYNWSPSQRLDGDKIVKQAIHEGKLADPNTIPCAICGRTDIGRDYHQEDYTQEHIVENSICVCRKCHWHIHMRWWRMSEYRTYMQSKPNGAKYMQIFDDYYQRFKESGGTDPARKP